MHTLTAKGRGTVPAPTGSCGNQAMDSQYIDREGEVYHNEGVGAVV